MRKLLVVAVALVLLLLVLPFPVSPFPVSAADPLPIEKVSDPAKQVKDLSTRSILLAQGINPDYVELIQDYALSTTKDDGKSPYTKTYTDLVSGKRIVEISQLPMVNANGQKVDTAWYTTDGKNFTAGVNQFIASVATNKVTVIAINDQPDGKTKKDHVLTYQPQLYLGVKEIKPLSTPTLLPVDPLNGNYTNNTLVWDYGIAKRYLRLIEGSLQGSWVFASDPGDSVRIVYNQTPDYTLRLGQYATDADTEFIPAIAFDTDEIGQPREYPFTISDSSTFYPDAHVETSSVDGRLQYASDPADWATLHDATDANQGDDTTAYLNTYIWSSATNNKWTSIYRSILLFDTSSLPDAAVISAVTASLYGYSTYGANFGSTLNWYSSNPASNVALVFADFDQVGTTALATAIAATSFNVGTPGTSTDWTFNATGIAAISKTGVTKLSFRENHDAANSAPTWESNKLGGCIPWSSDKGAGYQPKLVVTYTVPITPTVTTQAATSVEATTATGNGNITATGGENATSRGFQWDIDSGAPYTSNVTENGNFGTGAFTGSLTSLPAGTTIYYRAWATNSAGIGYGGEVNFLTKPAAPTNIAATDGAHTDKVVVTWTNSTGATGYKIYRDGGLIDTVGDVATYDDAGADAPTITPGNADASDNTTPSVILSVSGESVNNGTVHTYKLKATNASGDSIDSSTDTGYRGVGVLTYEWFRSWGDADTNFSSMLAEGGTTDPYSDNSCAPFPSGRYYYASLSATGATSDNTSHDRGYIQSGGGGGIITVTRWWPFLLPLPFLGRKLFGKMKRFKEAKR